MSQRHKIPDPNVLLPLVEANLKRRAIARRLGCSEGTVSSALARLRKAGRDVALCREPPARAIPPRREQELIRLVQRGESRENCAAHFRCSEDTVGRCLARLRRERGLGVAFKVGGRRNPHLRCLIMEAIANGHTTIKSALRACGRCGAGNGGGVVRELIASGAVIAVGRGRGRVLTVAPEKKGVAG